MGPSDAPAVAAHAGKAGPMAAALAQGVASHPERVRVVHMGNEYLGAFVLTELKGGVEEVSGLSLTDEALRTGAERAVLAYVLHAAQFAHKKAVEIVAPTGSPEARHLENEGFKPIGQASGGSSRFRVDVKH